jgi:predicted ATPase
MVDNAGSEQPPIDIGSEQPPPREILESSGYIITIDRERVKQLKLPDEMTTWLTQLPEQLQFDHPITLIVGDNGSGKTSFARAILEARRQEFEKKHNGAQVSGIEIHEDEPAYLLAQAITVNESRTTPGFRGEFIDGSGVMAEIKRWADD